jgi:hypothetical protein
MKTLKLSISLLMIIFSIAFLGCDKKTDDPIAKPAGKLIINFEHYLDNAPVVRDSFMYTNAAGNNYKFTLVRYFISDVKLYKSDGSIKLIDDWTDYFYIDTDIPSRLKWVVYDSIPIGDYDSISFHFGFKDIDNHSFMFVNQPESNMVWPEDLGGGYHYLQLEGKWRYSSTISIGYAYHLGRGQSRDANNQPVAPFFDNSFRVSLPSSSFSIADGKTTEVNFRMNIEKWFMEPHIWDHNAIGGDIMENQPAMKMAQENGWNVFSFHK